MIQVYSIARGPAESFVAALSNAELDQIASTVRSEWLSRSTSTMVWRRANRDHESEEEMLGRKRSSHDRVPRYGVGSAAA